MNQNRILYEDDHILVCHKPAGIATQTARIGQADMVSEMENYLARNQQHIYVVHRLDQPVEGILVFAKNQAAAATLSAQAAGKGMEKEYLALVWDLRGKETSAAQQDDGAATERMHGGEWSSGQKADDGRTAERVQGDHRKKSGILTDYLLKDGKTNTSRVVPPEVKGAKEARLQYEILRDIPSGSLFAVKKGGGWPEKERMEAGGLEDEGLQCEIARIRLLTGRHHQIRVQMANAGMPLLGDRKYADRVAAVRSENLGIREIALCAYRLSFCHPKTGERLHFEITPEGTAFRGIRS